MWGDLAEVMAQGLRGKRLGEERQYSREQALLDRVQADRQRAEERQRYQAQQERLAQQDARQGQMSALQMALMERQLAAPERDPVEEQRRLYDLQREYRVGSFAPRAPQQAPEVNWQRVEQADGSVVAWNPRTNETRPITSPTGQQLTAARTQGQPTEGERKAAAFYASGKQGYDTLESVLKDNPRPGLGAQMAAALPFGVGNVATSDQYRQMRQAGLMLSDAWLRYTSGAAVPEQEVERFAESFIPRAGDDDATLAAKAASRKRIIEALRDGAARALPLEPPSSSGLGLSNLARMGRHGATPHPENPYR